MTPKKYLLVGGHVGKRFVSAVELLRNYALNASECKLINSESQIMRLDAPGLIRLRPVANGDYAAALAAGGVK
jgi:hypothetical protein